MTPEPDLNALPDQTRLSLTPDERTAQLALVEAALAAASILPDPAPAEDEPEEGDGPAAPDGSEATEDGSEGDAEPPPPAPPPGVHADVVEPCAEARERFTALSPAAREGFFVVPRVPHGQGS